MFIIFFHFYILVSDSQLIPSEGASNEKAAPLLLSLNSWIEAEDKNFFKNRGKNNGGREAKVNVEVWQSASRGEQPYHRPLFMKTFLFSANVVTITNGRIK